MPWSNLNNFNPEKHCVGSYEKIRSRAVLQSVLLVDAAVPCFTLKTYTVGRLLSQAPASSYERVLCVLQKRLRRAQLPDWRSKITEKCTWLLRIHCFDPRVERMTRPITTTDARRGVGNLEFESLSSIRDSAIVHWMVSGFRCIVSKRRHYITR